MADDLKAKAEALPSPKEMRRYHLLMGELAALRGDEVRARAELLEARSLLSP